MTNTKVCPKCLKRKSLEEYKTRLDGRAAGYCYKCEIYYLKEYNKRRYSSPEARAAELARTKEKYWRIVQPQRMERKKTLIKKLGGKCNRCGYNKNAAALDFHHVNPVNKQRTISHLLAVNQDWAYEAALEEVKKCELLCSNCHREEKFPHWDMKKKGRG